MNVIEVKNVWKMYGKLVANEDISMKVNEGEIVALLGPNGAGKTTLVKQIYGELSPNKGEIKVLGKKPTDRQIKKLIGVIPQECEPYGDLTVWDNIYYMGRLKGVSKEVIKNISYPPTAQLHLNNVWLIAYFYPLFSCLLIFPILPFLPPDLNP